MKKISVVIVLMISIIILGNANCWAYSTSDFSINIPAGYNDDGENSFTNSNGENINIMIVPYKGDTKGELYTEEHLEDILKGVYSEVDSQRDTLKEELRKKNINYGAGLTEEEIEQLANSFKIESIVKKEVTTFSKNNYKGFHTITKYSMGDAYYYTDQYMVLSRNNIYTLTITGATLTEVNSSKNKAVVDSFTISNFQEEKSSSGKLSDKVLTSFFSTLILCGIGGIIGAVQKKKNNKSKTDEIANSEYKQEVKTNLSKNDEIKEEHKPNVTDSEDEKLQQNTEKKHCTNCGKEIEGIWTFCNHCGFKLK